MKKLIFIYYFLFILISVSQAQIINTVVGDGISAETGNGGAAIDAEISWPAAIKFDRKNNYYIVDGIDGIIHKVSSAGILTTIAGTGGQGYSGDNGLAINAEFNNPSGIAIDELGNIFIADKINNRIRKIDISTGIITTFAGTGVAGFSGDGGKCDTAEFNGPYDLCFDYLGNLYVADEANHRIRKIDTAHIITTIAGNGSTSFSGENGPAIQAGISGVLGLCTDSVGNIYLAARFVGRVLKIDINGIITTIAGTGLGFATGDEGPAIDAQINPQQVAFDNYGNLYIADGYKANIRKVDKQGIIHAVTIDTVAGFNGDGGPAIGAQFKYPVALGFDTCGNLYIADDQNQRIRKISFNPACWPEAVPTTNSTTPISIYPNPATTTLTITGSINKVQIINMLGQTVYTNQYSNTTKITIDISSLPTGVYFVKVNEGYVQKVVKE